MTARVLTTLPRQHPHRLLATPVLVAAPAFLLTTAVLSVANRAALGNWGWTWLDHHGVPWPSSLAVLPGGWLQGLAFATSGGALVALAVAVPRGARSALLAACGAGLLAAAFPLDVPLGDPGAVASWIRSWHAAVHAGGFAVAGLAGILAILASRRRADVATAAALAAAAALGGTPGWYAFVAGFFGWVFLLARRLVGDGGPAGRRTLAQAVRRR
jgi:hypothetical protein